MEANPASSEMFLEFRAILDDSLTPFGFSHWEDYEDLLGGTVSEYHRGEENVACIVSRRNVQVLSYLGNSFADRIISRQGAEKGALLRYLESLMQSPP